MTRPRLALIQRAARDVADAARRRRRRPAPEPGDASAAELARRLDETRERLRREIPPPSEQDPD
jgi:hypothetical protein